MSFSLKTSIFVSGVTIKLQAELSDEEVQTWLVHNWFKIIQSRVQKAIRRNGIDIQSTAETIALEFKIDDLASAPPDEIEEEALMLAEQDIITQLAKNDLPAPRNIRDHAIAALASSDKYYERAKARLIARAEVVRETLNH